jgi:glucose-1-phosphate thymidylyltransferase
LAQAFIIGKEFIGDDAVCLVLGDNIFYGQGFSQMLLEAVRTVEEEKQAVVFGYYVDCPERYGVAEFDEAGRVISIEEKPKQPKSHYAVVGLYFYPNSVVDIASSLKPSARGEYEITDINREYLRRGELKVEIMSRGFAWLDTGTHQSLADATNFVRAIVERQGLQMSCIEEIAYSRGWIDREALAAIADTYGKSSYGGYLRHLSLQG